MESPARPIVRFALGYIAAAMVATITLLVVQIVWVSLQGRVYEAMADLGDTILFYAIYSFPFTLVLGLAGWGLLQTLDRSSALAFAAIGAVLGFFAAGIWVTDGFRLDNPFLFSLTAAGATAALTFRRVYYGVVTKSHAAA